MRWLNPKLKDDPATYHFGGEDGRQYRVYRGVVDLPSGHRRLDPPWEPYTGDPPIPDSAELAPFDDRDADAFRRHHRIGEGGRIEVRPEAPAWTRDKDGAWVPINDAARAIDAASAPLAKAAAEAKPKAEGEPKAEAPDTKK